MTIKEAIEWLDPAQRSVKFDELENSKGIDTIDIAICKINAACMLACDILRTHLEEEN